MHRIVNAQMKIKMWIFKYFNCALERRTRTGFSASRFFFVFSLSLARMMRTKRKQKLFSDFFFFLCIADVTFVAQNFHQYCFFFHSLPAVSWHHLGIWMPMPLDCAFNQKKCLPWETKVCTFERVQRLHYHDLLRLSIASFQGNISATFAKTSKNCDLPLIRFSDTIFHKIFKRCHFLSISPSHQTNSTGIWTMKMKRFCCFFYFSNKILFHLFQKNAKWTE